MREKRENGAPPGAPGGGHPLGRKAGGHHPVGSPSREGKPCWGSRSALAVTPPIDVDPLPAGREVKSEKSEKVKSEKVK